MNRIQKIAVAGAIAGSMLLPAVSVLAASFDTVLFGGLEQVYGSPNATKTATLRLNVNQSEHALLICTDIANDNRPEKAHSVNLFEGQHHVPLTEMLPSITGNYDYTARVGVREDNGTITSCADNSVGVNWYTSPT
jgi:hypothetical protein